MRLSNFWTTCVGLVVTVALGAVMVSCGESPTNPGVSFGHIDRGEGHPTSPTIQFVNQPVVSFAPLVPPGVNINSCRIDFSFVVENATGRVWFQTIWIGGDHDGEAAVVRDADSLREIELTPASTINGMEIFGLRFHLNDGHSFDALRIQVLNQRNEVLAEDDSTTGGTSSCS